jgi:hypothetical protein
LILRLFHNSVNDSRLKNIKGFMKLIKLSD